MRPLHLSGGDMTENDRLNIGARTMLFPCDRPHTTGAALAAWVPSFIRADGRATVAKRKAARKAASADV